MNSCMPKEHQKYLDDLTDYVLEATNMSETEAKDFAFRLWQLKDSGRFKKLLFDNPPLKFEELCEDGPVFDKVCNSWRYVLQKDYDDEGFYDCANNEWLDFKEGRFYAREA